MRALCFLIFFLLATCLGLQASRPIVFPWQRAFCSLKHLDLVLPQAGEAEQKQLSKKLSAIANKNVRKYGCLGAEKLKQLLLQSLNQQGFWDANVKVELVKQGLYSKKFGIGIDSGLQRVVDLVVYDVVGCRRQKLPKVGGKITVGAGCDQLQLQKWVSGAREALQALGYWENKVKIQLQEQPVRDFRLPVQLLVYVRAGHPLRFGEVFVRSNTVMDPEKVKKFLCFQPGELWDSSRIRKSKNQLDALGVFKSVQIVCHNSAQPAKDSIPLEVQLEQDQRFEVKTSVKAAFAGGEKMPTWRKLLSVPKFEHEGCFVAKRMFDIADKVTTTLRFNPQNQSIDLRYQNSNPSFSDYPIELDSALARERVLKDGISTSSQFLSAGFQASLLKKMDNAVRVGLGMGAETFKLENRPAATSSGWAPYFFCEPQCFFDKNSGRWFNRSGAHSFVGLKLMWPYDRFHAQIIRLHSESALFLPLVRQACFVAKLQLLGSNFFHYSDRQFLPVDASFFSKDLIGSSLRGDEQLCLFPDLSDSGRERAALFDLIEVCQRGKRICVKLNTELRCLAYKNIGLSLFNNLCIDRSKKTQTSMLTGMGLRYHTPICAICLDVGWCHQRKSAVWRLALGEPF